MEDLNDLFYFAAVVQHNGFSAAERAIGVNKSLLSRRVAHLERQTGVRLLQRSTRTLTLTEAGARFYSHCQAVVDGARTTFDSVAEMRKEPAGTVRISCPVVIAQNYLAPILPGYMLAHPKVTVLLEATDRPVNLIDERFDLALRSDTEILDTGGLVAKELGVARRILVASPQFLDQNTRPIDPAQLPGYATMTSMAFVDNASARWELCNVHGQQRQVHLASRLVSSDLRVQLDATLRGVGIALLPEPVVAASLTAGLLEQVLPDWSGHHHVVHLVYPPPRGMLPSVRSFIDYLVVHLATSIFGYRGGSAMP
ncbi:MAG: LysR substrate-binding domain-containing protein [Janthinobacterium lividum]